MSLSVDRRGVPRVLRGAGAELLTSATTVATHSQLALRAVQAPAGREDGDRETLADSLAKERAAGYAEGHRAALEDARLQAERARACAFELAAASLGEASRKAAAVREDVVSNVASEALELTYELARAILGDESVAAALPPRTAFARALHLAPSGADLVVRLPPSSALSTSDLSDLCDTSRISIREDPSIEPGGCVVEVGACRIDTQISAALLRIRRVLTDARSDQVKRADRGNPGDHGEASA